MNTALGNDFLHPSFLRYSVSTFSSLSSTLSFDSTSPLPTSFPLCLTHLFNLIWSSHYIPSSWREANIVSLLKPGKNHLSHLPSSYRPIALTSVLCRMFERMVKSLLLPLLLPLLSKFQHGFLPSRSTYDCIHLLLRRIQSAFSLSSLLPVAFIDFSNAFDLIDHELLLYKLRTQFSITGPLFNFLKSFLSSRRIRCKHGKSFSDWFIVNAGVPQGYCSWTYSFSYFYT